MAKKELENKLKALEILKKQKEEQEAKLKAEEELRQKAIADKLAEE